MQASGSSRHGRQTAKGKGRAPPDDTPTSPTEHTKQDSSDEEDEDDEDNESGTEDEDDADQTTDTISGKPLFALDHCRQIGAKQGRYGMRYTSDSFA
ncbi:hypothetical protein M7I_7387 [Glarea lozoyensis 74030]|uniref:Uncharacterized protein n=1 Tax=Glarea lozoyensis (strain ATCC 74030 / MF5533) TaxID=1104152 RepID=H0EX61_GLAL7|nr:hypothetical protein M7I_7387 [Glarea lozoyensis 74030]